MALSSCKDMFSAAPFWGNGPSPGDLYNFPGSTPGLISLPNTGAQRSQAPVTTGTSVLGVKCDGGVVIAADVLGSFGSLARFRDVSRIMKVNENIVLGCGGDYADYQYLQAIIEQKVIDERCLDDGFALKPRSMLCWLTRVLYNRRTRLDPFWTNFVVGGVQDGQPYLGTVDKLGTAYEDEHIATGYGSYIALPLMRSAVEAHRAKKCGEGGEKCGQTRFTATEAKRLLFRCLEVLYYRDARSYPKFELVTITSEGAKVEGPITLESNWDIAHMVRGYD